MAGRQAKILTRTQERALLRHAASGRYPERDRVMVLLSIKAGCDPFLGSGSTGEVALLTGRKFIGCELSPYWFERACERLKVGGIAV